MKPPCRATVAARLALPLTVHFVFLASLHAVQSPDVASWTGTVNSDWFNGANWNTGIVPLADTEVRIESGASVWISNGTALLRSGYILNGNLTVTPGTSGAPAILDILPTPRNVNFQAKGNSTIHLSNGGEANGPLTLLNSSQLLVSGINPEGKRSIFGGEIRRSNGEGTSTRIEASDGGKIVLSGRIEYFALSQELENQILVTGIHANGTRSEFHADSYLTLSVLSKNLGRIMVADGATATIQSANISNYGPGLVVSGVHSSGIRSQIRLENLTLTSSEARVEDGGLMEVDQILLKAPNRNTVLSVTRTGGAETPSTISTEKITLSSSIKGSIAIAIADGGRVASDEVLVGSGAARSISVGNGQGQSTLEIGSIHNNASTFRLSLDSGTLRLSRDGNPLSGFSPGQIQFLKGGATIDTQDHAVMIDSVLDGNGALTKTGSGTLELSAANTFAGGLTIAEGRVLANNTRGSALGTGNITVLAAGTLSGSGSLAGNVINRGTVAPGNSPGTLHVGGNFSQAPNGTLHIEIAADGSHDLLKVSGRTQLAGTLLLSAPAGSDPFGQGFEFLNSQGPITGSFDKLESTNGVRPSVTIDSNSASFIAAPASYTQLATNPNQASLATALDTWIGSPDPAARFVSNQLDQLSTPEYGPAFDSMMPAIQASAISSALDLSQNQSYLLSQQLGSRRLRASVPYPGDHGWDAWAVASGLFSSGSMTSLQGDDFTSGSLLTGADCRISSQMHAGVFAGFSDASADFGSTGESDQQRLVFGAYADYANAGYYANAAIGGGPLDLDTTRNIRFGGISDSAHSSADGSEFFALASGGYDFKIDHWTFGPSAILQYSQVQYDRMQETGAAALNLHTDDSDSDSLRSLIGARLAYEQSLQNGYTLIPEARAFWQHEYLADGETLNSTLQGGTNPGFIYQAPTGDRDSAFLGLGCGLITPFGLTGNLSYDIELGRNQDTNQTISTTLNWKF